MAELSVLLIALNSEEGETSCLEDGERKNKTQALDLKPGHQANRHSPYWLPPLVLQHCHVWRCLQQDFSHCKTRQKSGTRPCTRGATQLEAKNATSCKLLTELLETSYNGAKTRILGWLNFTAHLDICRKIMLFKWVAIFAFLHSSMQIPLTRKLFFALLKV